ncbi:hypothetical protein [Georgenia yuyongxinii]
MGSDTFYPPTSPDLITAGDAYNTGMGLLATIIVAALGVWLYRKQHSKKPND